MPSRPSEIVPGAFMAAGGPLGTTASTPQQRRGVDTSIEALRVIATFLLVSYHVMNGPEMKTIAGAAHPLRLVSEFFVDLRMPLFAFISGYVYAIRPIGTGPWPSFVLGKARRLLVPGAIAALSFAAASALLGRRFTVPFDEIWRILLYPYAHYWFLQSIFLILLLVALSEKLIGPRVVMPLFFVMASAALVSGYWLPIQFFSAQGAAYLLPYFTLGALVVRHRDLLDRNRGKILAVTLPLLVGTAAWNISLYSATGAFSQTRHDLQSWMFAVSACLLLILFPVRSRHFAAFGAFSFTIYLYHVFGTAGAREALTAIGIHDIWLLYAGGVVAGFGLPIVLHLAVRRFGPARRLILGLR